VKGKRSERKKETFLGYITPPIPALLVRRNVTTQAPSDSNNTSSNTNNTSNNINKENSRIQSQKKF
jgi:hypothetical protein